MRNICVEVILLVSLLSFSFVTHDSLRPIAQITIAGKVTIWNDIPLENIKITATKSKRETFSNQLGEFSIEIMPKDKLRFSADGFINHSLKVRAEDGSKEIKVEMELLSYDYAEESELLNDGFRYIPNVYRTTAIERLRERRKREFASYNSVWDIIRGRIAGVVVQNNNAYFREGLSGSVNAQSVPAIIVLNGTRVGSSVVTNLDPHNVKDITLLKGASATIYGGSGGSGVIVITTI